MLLPVILAGGAGARLWPLSRELNPKQFMRLMHNRLSMLQQAITRLQEADVALPQLICNEQHRFLVAEQLRQLGMEQASILLEPVGRGTAPAIALAACKAIAESKNPILLVLSVDHLLPSIPSFLDSLALAVPLAISGKLLTFGITASSPHTGGGFMEKGKSAGGGGYCVKRFVDELDTVAANDNQACGNYYRRSGMFMFRASSYIEEMERLQPQMLSSCRAALAAGSEEGLFTRVDESLFAACPSSSIENAIMEKSCDVLMVPLQSGWSNASSWSAIWTASDKDAEGNVLLGDVLKIDTRNTYVRANSRLVATLGVDNLIIVETKDAVLVSHKDKAHEVDKVVDQLRRDARDEHINHREVCRPWGVYDSIDNGQRYQVKRITVNPGAKLSLQMHHHRAEHWIVVSGTAKVTNGSSTYLVSENQSTYIPIGQVHALENPGLIPLELIEVQSGSYLAEDDIIRFEDQYGRV